MNSLKKRLVLITTLAAATVIVFGFLGFSSFQDLNQLKQGLNESQQLSLEIYSVDYLKPKPQLSQNVQLLERLKNVKPDFRAKAFENAIQKRSNENLNFLARTEAEYHRHILPLIEYTQRRTLYFTAIAIGSSILFIFSIYIYLATQIFAPIHYLKSKMYEFLNNRYSYQFIMPAANEIGQLHGTFNTLAQKVLDQIRELKDLDKAKTEFLSIASHELRTPLTSIKGSLSLLNSNMLGELPEQAKPLTAIALEETDRLIRIINELLDLAKIEARQFPLKFEWVSAQSFIQKTFSSLQGFGQHARVQLATDVTAELQLHIDVDRMQQVLTNLLSNAIKFSPAETEVHVRFHAGEDGALQIEVKDSGPGIAPQDQELIFEKFRQATGPNNPLVKGTGLGLAIAKALVEQHGGQIGVHSRPGAGATFYFTLPAERFSLNSQQGAAA